MKVRLRIFPALLIVALAASLAAFPAMAADSQGHFDRTLTVTGPVDLDVQTGSGDITVRPGDSGKVEIHAKIHANGWGDVDARIQEIEKNPPIEQSGNTIRIGHIENHDLLRHISISYEVIVPAETKLHSESGSGDVEVKGVSGAAKVSTGSGSITAQGDPKGDWRLRTGSGNVTVDFPKQASFNVVARTSSGNIETTHEITIQGKISPRELQGKVGAGGPVVELSTSSGSIQIR